MRGTSVVSMLTCLGTLVVHDVSSFSTTTTTTTTTTCPTLFAIGTLNDHHHHACVSRRRSTSNTVLFSDSGSSSSESVQKKKVPAPSFDGNVVFPMRAMSAGLKGHDVSCVYAVLNGEYKRQGNNNDWKHCEFVGVTKNLDAALQTLLEEHGSSKVAHVRAVSFQYPQRTSMEELANRWLTFSQDADGNAMVVYVVPQEWESDNAEQQRRQMEASKYLYDNDDDDDDDEEEEDYNEAMDMAVQSMRATTEDDTVISPFSPDTSTTTNTDDSTTTATTTTTLDGGRLAFTKENVDRVLEEVRPYLISDGGNVSVQRVDEQTKNVYLVLEGACGSCPSSTVTMSMGIERVLKEQFANLGEVIQVENDDEDAENNSKELTMEKVQIEVRRLTPAISAMGGTIEIVSVDPIGQVEIRFRGSNKIRHGLELAILDIPYAKHVKFVD